jgi:hypothetical protein
MQERPRIKVKIRFIVIDVSSIYLKLPDMIGKHEPISLPKRALDECLRLKLLLPL